MMTIMSQMVRRSIWVLLLIAFTFWTQAQDNATATSISADIMAAHDFGIHLFNTLETAGIEDYVAEDWVLHDPGNSGYSGIEGFTTWAMSFHAPMPDFEVVHLEPLVGDDEYLTYRWEFTGTHTGEVPGIAPTGNEVYMTGMVFHHIVDGKFAETWLYFDNMALLAQLGLLETLDGLKQKEPSFSIDSIRIP